MHERSVVGLVQQLRTLAEPTVPCRRLRDVRHEMDVLLFTHLATASEIVVADMAQAHVQRKAASLAYCLRERDLALMADGIEAIVDSCLHERRLAASTIDMPGVLRVLLALAGGHDGTTFTECCLGPSTIQLLRAQPTTPNTISNLRRGEAIVQSNVGLLVDPTRLYGDTPFVANDDEADALVTAFTAVPGKSDVQSDVWRDQVTAPSSLFGALHHTTFHRSDAQLERFEISMALPTLAETAPDMVQSALLTGHELMPKRLQGPQPRHRPKPIASSTPRDAPELLFSQQQRTVHIPITSSPERDLWCEASAETAIPTGRTGVSAWEELGPHTSTSTPRSMLRLGRGLYEEDVYGGHDALCHVVRVHATRVIDAVLLALQGTPSDLFAVRRDTMSMCVVSEELRLHGAVSRNLRSLLTTLATTATYVVRLQALADALCGRQRLALAECLHTFLAAQQAYLLDVHAPTVLALLTTTRALCDGAAVMASVFCCDDDTLWVGPCEYADAIGRPVLDALPSSDGAFLDHVYDKLVLGQICAPPTTTLYMWLFTALSAPYLASLSRALFVGDEELDGRLPHCLAKYDRWVESIAESRTLLRLVQAMAPTLYGLLTATYEPLRIETSIVAIQAAQARHAAHLDACQARVATLKQARLQALADAIVAMQRAPRDERAKTSALDDALRQKQLRKARQALQKELLDAQIAADATLARATAAKVQADDARAADAQAARDAAKFATDKDTIVAIYADLMERAEHRHRVQLWRQARLARKQVASLQLDALLSADAATWLHATQGASTSHPYDDLLAATSRQDSGASSGEVPVTRIKVLQAPGGHSDGVVIPITESTTGASSSVRVLRAPGGGGDDAKHILYGNRDDDDALAASFAHIRVQQAPGGCGEQAAEAMYRGDTAVDDLVATIKVLHVPGGGGDAAASALYEGANATCDEVASVRVLREPGGGGDDAADAIYGTDAALTAVVRGIKVLQVPGGGGGDAAALLYPSTDDDDTARPLRSQVKVSQEPGGSGSDMWHMLYAGADATESSYRPGVRVLSSAPGGVSDDMADVLDTTRRPDNDVASIRSQVRVQQAPGGDGNDVADTLYAQFTSLSMAKSSVRILQPAGGGKDSVGALLRGPTTGGTVDRERPSVPSTADAPRTSRQWLQWKLARASMAQAYASTELLPRTVAPLEMATMAALYTQLLGHEPDAFAPIDTLLVASLDAPIRGFRALVGAVALDALRDDMRLVDHLATLHDTMLLSGGLWVDMFIKTVVDGLDHAKVQWGAPDVLNDAMASAMTEASYTPRVPGRFAYASSSTLTSLLAPHAMSVSVASFVVTLTPTYVMPDALTLFLPPSAVAKYVEVHRFLFQLKATLAQLHNARRRLRWLLTRVQLALQERRAIDRALYCQHHVAATLHSYTSQVLVHEWHALREAVATATDTMALQARHDAYVATLLARCFLTRGAAAVQTAVQTCLTRLSIMCTQLQLGSIATPDHTKELLLHVLDAAQDHDGDAIALCDALRHQRECDGHASAFVEDLLLQLNWNGYYGS
ncbi:hypothetical protein SDRG_08763 [Saprolegnia diclina VS20]|uniref:Gamma tubulin complex component C-terminal domain-containing protein n=1 Tax=Saprolegnia diclina (strain VS20) TaxID=1156394 RepID=T0Q718_SAPDV|nr:hypothetical protein SDRG_08763 [Saprolegnia diclina VS20]EQC33659.1 hypothetical protein SDRG_08763 [Saprolegnia diclina VS20]|eukprot:XP_008612882.1 hypothetical protein SDRG_08763 [Saprolegnia diclina VS20]